MKKETIVRSLRIGLFVGMLAWTVCAAPSVSQRVFPQMVAMADETEEITQVSVGTVLKNGDRLKLDQEYHFYSLNSGTVTIPANTEICVVPYTEAEHALGFQIGDSVYGIRANSSGSTGILLDSISIGYISENTLIFFDNQVYTNYVSTVYVGDGILKGVSGSISVLDGETVKYIRRVDDAGTIVFSDDSTMPLPEGNYNGWKVVGKENNASILEPCYFEKEFSINVPEGIIVEGADGNTANLGDSVVLKTKRLYCVLDGTQTKTVSDMTRDADGYYCYTVNRVLNDVSAEYRTVVRTKEELLHAKIGDWFVPSENFSMDCADGEGNIYCVFVDGCIRTWEENGNTKTIFAEINRKNGGQWTRASANGYRGHIQFNEDATIQGTYEAADTNIPAVDLNTPVNGWVVKRSVYKQGAYSDGNGGMINRYAFSLYGAEYTEPEPQFFVGKVLHVGDTVRLDGPLRYLDKYGYQASIPAGTEVTFGENTDSNYFWCRYAFSYNGSVYPIYSSAVNEPYFENPTYLPEEGTLVISGGSSFGENGFDISGLRYNVVFGKNMPSEGYCNGDVLAGVAGDSMFDAEKLFVVNGNQPVSAWGIDENGNLIDANHEIVYASDQNNAWRITSYEVVDGTGVFTVEPYQFSALLNVSAEEGIEVIGAENGTVPAFGSVTFRSKEPMCVEYDGHFYDIREMTVDAEGYYVIEFPTVVKDISARQSTVITNKAGLEFAKTGDIFMPTVDEEITEEDTYLDQFIVKYATQEYEVIGGESGTTYTGEDGTSGVMRGYDNILRVYSDSSLGYTDEFWWDGTRVTRRYYPATSENHRSNSWIIVSVAESRWMDDQSCGYSIDLEGYDAPYTYHDAVAPTCTEDGNVAHWTDLAGRYFADDAGAEPMASVTDPATGHDYQTEYIWKKSKDTYTCTAKVTCSHEDMDVEYVDLDVTKEGNTYTATGQFDELALGDTYVVEFPSYQITVENGTFGQWEGTTVTVEQETKVTVCANEPAAGSYFAGWYVNDGQTETLVSKNTTYTFFAEKDMTLVAKYEEEEPVFDANDVTGDVNWTRSVKTAEKDVISTTASYSVSNENYAIKQVGYVYAAGEWTNETMTLDAEGIRNKYMTCNAYNAYYTFNLNLGKAAIATLRPYYIIYNWKTGQEEQIVYGDVVVSTPNR